MPIDSDLALFLGRELLIFNFILTSQLLSPLTYQNV